MIEKIKFTLALLIEFIKNPYNKRSQEIKDDDSLVFIASIISGVAILVVLLSMPNSFVSLILSLVIGAIFAYIFALLTVHFHSAIYSLFLKHIITPLFKVEINDYVKVKQLKTYSSIGIIVSVMPVVGGLGFIVSILLEVLGLTRLFNLDLHRSILITTIYHAIWWLFFNLIF